MPQSSELIPEIGASSKNKGKWKVGSLHSSSAKQKRPLIPSPTVKRRPVSKEICKQCGSPFGRASWVWGEHTIYLGCPHPPDGCGGEQSVEMDCPCLWDGAINPDNCLRCGGTGESTELHPCWKCGGTGEVTEIWPCEGECYPEAWADGKKHPNSTSRTSDPAAMLCSEVRAEYMCGARKDNKKH